MVDDETVEILKIKAKQKKKRMEGEGWKSFSNEVKYDYTRKQKLANLPLF